MTHPLKAIKATFSFRLSVKMLALVAIGTAAAGLIFYGMASRIALPAPYGEIVSNMGFYKKEIALKSFFIYSIFTVLMLAGVFVLSLLYSHRVAGPLQRVKAVAREIAKGNLSISVKFRHKDVIHPLAEELNSMIHSHVRRRAELESGLMDMKRCAEDLDAAVRRFDRAALEKATADLQSASSRVGKTISEIKL